jgi:hypothetical protein
LRIGDSVEAKSLLVKQLKREIQGLRTASNQFSKLDKINPKDISKIVDKVQKKLGY